MVTLGAKNLGGNEPLIKASKEPKAVCIIICCRFRL